MLESLRNRRILVIAAHPDDELLGAGATINRLVIEYGCEARALILGEGITSRGDRRSRTEWQKALKIHKANIENARQFIGYRAVHALDFPDNRFDTIALLDLIKAIEKEKDEFGPDMIFTHHGGDLNIDHRLTFQAVVTASRPIEGESVKSIISFETPSATEWQASSNPYPFVPNLFIEVREGNLDSKIRAMQSYELEKRDYPHPRSPEALETLAKKRGVEVGLRYAEAFCLVRDIV